MRRSTLCACLLALFAAGRLAGADDLRLIPYPKSVRVLPGRFTIPKRCFLSLHGIRAEAAGELSADLVASGVTARLETSAHVAPGGWRLDLARDAGRGRLLPAPPPPAQNEGYSLRVSPPGIVATASSQTGIVHAISTLRQLLRANMEDRSLPCVEIQDWPSLRYRGFLDDITRGPSPTLAQLQHEAELTGYLRMNFLTYYLEHQFAFRKHPEIGPKQGSLTPADLSALVRFAEPRGVEIIGCQQSFGHFGNILKYPQYRALRETGDVLTPTNEASYRLLDDLYSEQAPLLPSKLFLVCCDETYGLGAGPSKPLVEKIGIGGVYARHIQRIHDLITGKYGKRMMMWGDIILQHPDHLREIPKDTLMLSWGYGAEASFDHAILPFKRAGFDFFVCPGVSNWSRILPDFQTSVTNIRNYVRDGAAQGALGVLNTTWDDDGETLFGPNLYGIAFGAECAWSGSKTSVEAFNRRIGAVLFGERGDHFGRAIELLSRAHSLPGYGGMMDSRFWQAEDGRLPVSRETAEAQARALIAVVEPAIGHLRQARAEARFNREALDTYLFGAERMRFMAIRTLHWLAAADAYQAALDGQSRYARADVAASLVVLRADRDVLIRSRAEYARLWRLENRPYSLDGVLARYDQAIARYDRPLTALAKAAVGVATLPSAESIGLSIVELGLRSTRPSSVRSTPLNVALPWASSGQPRRLGITVSSGQADRIDQPFELDLPAGVTGTPELMEVADGRQAPVSSQVTSSRGGRKLMFIAAGRTPRGSERAYLLYFGASGRQRAATSGVTATPAKIGYWVDNGPLRLLIGTEGAHIYRWELKAMANRDLTQPGETDWQGFADINGRSRNAENRIEVLEAGPVRVRLRCTDPTGLAKTIDIWRGVPWVECTLNMASPWFACYDDIALMGQQNATPGRYLFEDGQTGPLPALSSSTDCQVRRDGQRWSAKYVAGGPLIALLTPEVATRHVVGPGAGMGAVFIEGSPDASHFAIYGGLAPAEPRAALETLRATLDYRHPPGIALFQAEDRAPGSPAR